MVAPSDAWVPVVYLDADFGVFTGPTFSPDGKILFANIQVPGITLAVTGPWQRYLG
jgi:secreted PhoX family phosphatase